ncbi:MAG: hypothetical protein IJV76_13400 [Clostridia bacterium]|nr:hypothetical protein [Clostridia bacterium]
MDLYFLDAQFEPVTGAVDVCSSIVWSERYFENGSFTLHFPKELLPSVYDAVYVRTGVENGRIKCGRIEYVITDDEEESGGCEMGGRLLESLLDDRILAGKGCCTGTLTEAVCAAVSDNLRGCGVVLGDSAVIDDAVSLTYEWDTLSEWLYSVLRPYGASYRIELDPDRNVPVFRIVRGIDRSSGVGNTLTDHYNTWQAVFSTSFGNISSIRFERDTSGQKNVVYVEGSDGTAVTVDVSGGGPKREMYKSVSDVKPADFANVAAYTAALRMRGAEILANYTEVFHIAAETDTGVFPKYGVDYALGDLCDVADHALGLSFGMRLTAVDDVTENGTRTLYPSFGEEVRQVRRLIGGKRY